MGSINIRSLLGANLEVSEHISGHVVGLAAHLAVSKVYYFETGSSPRIARANMDGTDVETVSRYIGLGG